jgi:hypothetical protein
VIRYHRRRFIERTSAARLSIDRDITVPRVNPRLLGTVPGCTLPEAVIEIKGSDDGLPLGLTPLRRLGLMKASFSKYLECYARLTGTVF